MTGFVRKLYTTIIPHETRQNLYKLRHPDEYRKLRTTVYSSKKGDFSLKPFDENECIFIHITKTAGTSVSKSLFNYLPYHYTAIEYRVIYGRQKFNKYFKFAFVRNPWDRVYSAFRYLKAGGWDYDDKMWAEHHLKEYESFGDFVKTWLSIENINAHMHFWPQTKFVCDKNNKLLIDYLAYFETINDDYDAIRKKLGTGQGIAHHNANPGNSYRDAYDDISRDIVARVYSTDIKLFGYNFNGIKERKIINN